MDFKIVKNGYCKEQIDSYIDTFSAEYKKIQDKYKELLEDNKDLSTSLQDERDNTKRQQSIYEEQRKDSESQIAELKLQLETMKADSLTAPNTDMDWQSSSDVIAKALIDAEILAKQIIYRARQEAAQITSSASEELEKLEKAKKQVLNELEKIQLIISSFKK